MRLEQLEYVRTVTETGSLRRAAERLHISQPALSEAISKLERELGATLLDRHQSGTRINSVGRELLPRMIDVLDAAERLRAAARREATIHRPTRVGSVYFGVTAVVLPALRRHEDDHAYTAVELHQARQEDVVEGLRHGTLDVGLVNLLPGDDLHADLVATELVQGRPVAVVPGGHRLARQTSLTVDELRQETFIGAHEGFLMHRVARRIFGDEPPVKWHTADGAELCKQMVSSGLGVSLMPDFSMGDDALLASGGLAVVPISDDDTFIRMVLAQRRGARLPSSAENLVEHLAHFGRELAAQTS